MNYISVLTNEYAILSYELIIAAKSRRKKLLLSVPILAAIYVHRFFTGRVAGARNLPRAKKRTMSVEERIEQY